MAESSWPTVAGGNAVTDVQWEKMAAGFSPDGIIGAPTDTPVIYADSTGRQIKIRANKTAIVRGHGWDSGSVEFTKAVTANASGSTRIDRAVLRLTRSTWAVTSEIKTGTPGAGAPALTQDAAGSASGVWEISLGTITVGNGVSTLNAGDVAPDAKYVGATAYARPVVYNMLPPSAPSGTWTNTAPPTSDSVSATGMYSVSASRLTIAKQDPASALEVTLNLSGFTNAVGRVYAGCRVMASGYTSSNHIVAAQYYNYPVSTAVGGTQLGTTLVAMQNHADHAHGVSPQWHDHPLNLPHQHLPWGGVIQVPSLAVRTYTLQPWIYVASGQTFNMDSNDTLSFRVAEV